MLAAVGCLVPEVLSLSGVELGEPVWWKVGAAKLNGDLTINWGGIEVRPKRGGLSFVLWHVVEWLEEGLWVSGTCVSIDLHLVLREPVVDGAVY